MTSIPKSLLKAELSVQIGQIQQLLSQIPGADEQVKREVSQAINHLYQAKKMLNLDNMN